MTGELSGPLAQLASTAVKTDAKDRRKVDETNNKITQSLIWQTVASKSKILMGK